MEYHIQNLALCLTMAFGISGCYSVGVVSDKDASEDFSKFKTFEFYGWAHDSDKIMNRLEKERIESAFGAEAAKRGLSKVEKDGDIIVSLFIATEKRSQTTAQTMHTGGAGMGGPGWGWGGGGAGGNSHTTITEHQFTMGSLAIEAYDKEDKKLIWQAIGTSEIDKDPKKREKHIPKKVQMIMLEYPVKPIQ